VLSQYNLTHTPWGPNDLLADYFWIDEFNKWHHGPASKACHLTIEMSRTTTAATNLSETHATWAPLPSIDTSADVDTLDNSVSPASTAVAEDLSTENVEPLRHIEDHVQSCSSPQLRNAQRYSYESLQSSLEEPSQYGHNTSSHIGNNERHSYSSVRLIVAGQYQPVAHASSLSSHHTSEAANWPTLSRLKSRSLPRDWLPYMLRRTFLLFMATTSLALSVALAILCWASVHNHGLRNDTNTTGLIIARRYVPTVLAVFITQALVMISDDVKRTVPFARLAGHGADRIHPQHTWLYVPKPWWNGLGEGFVKNRSGVREGWVLIFSSLATGISVLTVSAL
jgi:hypothetical protein